MLNNDTLKLSSCQTFFELFLNNFFRTILARFKVRASIIITDFHYNIQ